jgi:Tol biopolymer transport system component
MGEVYCARDRELDRLVALKVLPDLFNKDPERVSRFKREAKTLASLNHPHIAQIYGLVHGPADTGALAMEFVEGEDLAERLRRGPVALDEALSISRQIAEALEAAHEIGVVHRDLKPANIKVRPDDVVKVLDFGLARMAQPLEPLSPGLESSPTMTSPVITERGVILGTAAYMSPEQAKGRVVDRRSDIWALGCVLYEMLAGHQAFARESPSETMTSVLRDTPDWQRLPAGTPNAIRRLLRRCLEKDPAKRLDSAAAVRMEIEDLMAGDGDEPAGPVRARGRERLGWTLAAIFAVAAMLATGVAFWLRQPTPTPQEIRLDITTPDAADAYSFALSPDGTKVIYLAGGDKSPQRLWLRSFDSTTPTPVAETEGAVHPFWAPDGRSIGFFVNGKLKRVDLAGGGAVTLADAPASRGGSWNADGTILFAPMGASAIFRMSASGSDIATATTQLGAAGHQFPVWHPDGKRFFYFLQSGDPNVRGVYLATIDQPIGQRIVAADGSAEFRPPAQLIYVRDGTLLAQSFDDATNTVAGTPTPLANPVPSLNGRSAFAVSAAGPLAYRTGRMSRAQLRWFKRNGEALEDFAEPDLATPIGPVLSPSGQRVAIRRSVQGNEDIWILDRTRAAPIRLTSDPAPDTFPVWSPDETRMVFRSRRPALDSLFETPLKGDGGDKVLLLPESLSATLQAATPTDWSRDGRWLVFLTNDPESARDLWVLPMRQPDAKAQIVLATRFDETNAKFSPDGRWLAYQTNESGRYEIAVRAFPSGGRTWQVSSSGGVLARWSHDGNELYFVAPDGILMAAPVDGRGAEFRAGAPVPLFTPAFTESVAVSPFTPQYDVSRDGRFLINLTLDRASATPITLVLNWPGRAR